MPTTYFIRDLLLSEFETEIQKTSRLFKALPSDRMDFRPHQRSMTLGRLAGHTSDLHLLIALTLTTAELDMAADWVSHTETSKEELLERFGINSERALAAVQQSSDEVFQQPWLINRGASNLYTGNKFHYYRNQGVNQIVHHRAQLGTYIRALDLPLPGMYDQSADGI